MSHTPTVTETPTLEELLRPDDLRHLTEMGIAAGEAERQLALFRDPPPPIHLLRPCRIGDGILRFDEAERLALAEVYAEAAAAGRVTKFVPASGAASRMFRLLTELRETGPEPERVALEAAAAAGNDEAARALELLSRLDELAFQPDLAAALERRDGPSLDDCLASGDYRPLLDALLDAGDGGLGYAERPKALIPFHRYPDGRRRTPFEEHLVEAAAYARGGDGTCRLHLTVPPEHEVRFMALLERLRPLYEQAYESEFEVDYSHQARDTDTLAVDPDGRPFRLDDGSLLLRPGGHGALLRNLGDLGDLVLIKNVDNVVPESVLPTVAEWKRALGGKLVALQQQVFEHLAALEDGDPGDEELAAAERFVTEELSRPLPAEVAGGPPETRRAALVDHLDRPLRVCGVVENQDEPGGGPFWVRSPSGEVSLQIVEKAQIDSHDPSQAEALAAATHFNPVDIACGLRDRRGRPYRLSRFVDADAVFIAEKDHQGRRLRALERPGLWNGAMAGWNTVFVEVPLATFAPVKTVLDLLRPEHQAGG